MWNRVIRRRFGDKVKMGKTGWELDCVGSSPVLSTSLLSLWLALGSWCMSFYPPPTGPAPRERSCARPDLASPIDWRGKYWQSRTSTELFSQSKHLIREFKHREKIKWKGQFSYHPLTEVTRCPGMTFCCESGKSHPPSAVFGFLPGFSFRFK